MVERAGGLAGGAADGIVDAGALGVDGDRLVPGGPRLQRDALVEPAFVGVDVGDVDFDMGQRCSNRASFSRTRCSSRSLASASERIWLSVLICTNMNVAPIDKMRRLCRTQMIPSRAFRPAFG
jgi:hypothetical protein